MVIRKQASVEPLQARMDPRIARVRYTERVVPLPEKHAKLQTDSSDSIMFINQVDLPVTDVLAHSPPQHLRKSPAKLLMTGTEH